MITTPFGLFQYLRLPMGIKIAPSFAQSVMDSLYGHDNHIEVFMDDIAVFSTGSFASHLEILRSVPTPTDKDVLQRRASFTYVSVIDITSQFYHFNLDNISRNLCVITTPFGLFQYLRLPMGIKIDSAFLRSISYGLSLRTRQPHRGVHGRYSSLFYWFFRVTESTLRKISRYTA